MALLGGRADMGRDEVLHIATGQEDVSLFMDPAPAKPELVRLAGMLPGVVKRPCSWRDSAKPFHAPGIPNPTTRV